MARACGPPSIHRSTGVIPTAANDDLSVSSLSRHCRACPGNPCSCSISDFLRWMPGSSPGMTSGKSGPLVLLGRPDEPGDDTLRSPALARIRLACYGAAMAAPLKSIEGRVIAAAMREIGARAKAAARTLALASTAQKDAALAAMAAAIRARKEQILAANAENLAAARASGATAAFVDRLALDAKRVEAMAAGVEVVRQLADPVGTVSEAWTRPNGMRIERVRVPLGVIGVIYESRPNVTADAGALCLKAGNAVILRG